MKLLKIFDIFGGGGGKRQMKSFDRTWTLHLARLKGAIAFVSADCSDVVADNFLRCDRGEVERRSQSV